MGDSYEIEPERYWVAGVVFLLAWGYATLSYGFLLGFGLGWIPALILSEIAGTLWRFVLGALVLVVAVMLVAIAADLNATAERKKQAVQEASEYRPGNPFVDSDSTRLMRLRNLVDQERTENP